MRARLCTAVCVGCLDLQSSREGEEKGQAMTYAGNVSAKKESKGKFQVIYQDIITYRCSYPQTDKDTLFDDIGCLGQERRGSA